MPPTGAFSIAQLAKRLGTTTAHARYLLARHPVDWSPPRYRRTQETTARVHQWKIWYEDSGLSLDAIADRAQVSRAAVRIALSKHGVSIRRSGGRPAYADQLPDVCHRRHVLEQPVSHIAEATGISATTIRSMLARQQEPRADSGHAGQLATGAGRRRGIPDHAGIWVTAGPDSDQKGPGPRGPGAV
ncbi:hypothetical protein [Streptomyces sp. RTd22]|uniref:hypothetical protein n=1 Tax=Streptomyces sp. RTd22 TaxID=1841249 RepID=UPI0007C44840|nr:hypothetical protein [Streptomyces sp. RTd22]